MSEIEEQRYQRRLQEATETLRLIATGDVMAYVLMDNHIEPVFGVPDRGSIFCVVDDAGEYDYTAWFAQGQHLLVMYPDHA